MTRPEPWQLVDELHDLYPLDERNPDLSVAAGEGAAQLVRKLNHDTLTAGTLRYASHGYRLTGELAAAAHGSGQLYSQLAAWTADLSNRADLLHVSHRREGLDAQRTAAEASMIAAGEAFAAASGLARQLADQLDAAHSALAPIEHNTTDVGDEQEG